MHIYVCVHIFIHTHTYKYSHTPYISVYIYILRGYEKIRFAHWTLTPHPKSKSLTRHSSFQGTRFIPQHNKVPSRVSLSFHSGPCYQSFGQCAVSGRQEQALVCLGFLSLYCREKVGRENCVVLWVFSGVKNAFLGVKLGSTFWSYVQRYFEESTIIGRHFAIMEIKDPIQSVNLIMKTALWHEGFAMYIHIFITIPVLWKTRIHDGTSAHWKRTPGSAGRDFRQLHSATAQNRPGRKTGLEYLPQTAESKAFASEEDKTDDLQDLGAWGRAG